MKGIFLDYAATTPVLPQFLKIFNTEIKRTMGNPSSIHKVGLEAKEKLNEAREIILKSLNAKEAKCIFTSSGTEANNLAIIGSALSYSNKGNHIITSSYEHHCVLNSLKKLEKNGFRITYINPDENGYITLENIKKHITKKTILLTCMYVNNELGVINNIAKIGALCKEKNIVFHTDTVAATGKIKIDFDRCNIDLASISSHKIYVPKGSGALIIRNGIKITPILFGGGQEFGLRAGTPNLANAYTLAKAIEYFNNNPELNAKVANLKDYFEKSIITHIPDTVINCRKRKRAPHISNISFLGVPSEDLVLNLSEHGIYASTGAACISENGENISHVLASLTISKERKISAVRFSFGLGLTKKDINIAVGITSKCVNKIRSYS